MSVNPNEILATATKLAAAQASGDPALESDLRSCASRAYYAALHAADMSLPADISPSQEDRKGKQSHQAVIDALVLWSKSIRPGRSEAIVVARNLPKLRTVRKRADYAITADFNPAEAVLALKTASATIASAERAGRQSTEAQLA